MISLEEGRERFNSTRTERRTTLLPDPARRQRLFRLVSVDDHLVEPPGMFDERLPKKFIERAPHVVELDDGLGTEVWNIDGVLLPNIGFGAIAGRPREQMSEPTRFEEMRPGAWDIHHRITDMDIDGVSVSVCFPSSISGFAGQRYSQLPDNEYGYALFRAYNQWHLEQWAGVYPDRMIATQLAWLCDPAVSAQNVRENAELGFKAISFPENPHPLGFPSLHSDYWDPLFRACEETDTVICLHLGSSSTVLSASPDCTEEEVMVLFPANAQLTIVEWIFSKIPLRFPRLKIVLTEGGISWVPLMVDRLDHYERKFRRYMPNWRDESVSPLELLRRNFWFCTLQERSVVPIMSTIGVDKVMTETDYPHSDSTWPDSQETIASDFASLSPADFEQITHENAEMLFSLNVTSL